MDKLLIFGILSIPILVLSGKSLLNLKSHCFYRFLSWECILWLAVSNTGFWFDEPFSPRQIISWILLFYSIYPVTAGTILLRKAGKPSSERDEQALYGFEKTTKLVDTGIFSHIRHPLYSSLLFLAWGIFLKNPDVLLLFVSLASTGCLFTTAIFDEKECLKYFGEDYRYYMKRTKRFIPYLF